ncbi:hypothetical protein BDR04DRAFT_1210213, partial [Suillus decipiens]
MARFRTSREQYLHSYLLLMVLRTLFQPEVTLEEAAAQLHCDLSCILAIQQTRYLQERSPVAKAGTLHIAWEYANSPSDHFCFIHMLRVSPMTFQVLLDLIEGHPVFSNN